MATVDTARLQELAIQHLWLHFTQMAGFDPDKHPVMARGDDIYLYDTDGNRYMDFLSGLFTVQIGYSHGEEIGQASALKMCFAAIAKGVTALATEALTAGRLLGVAEPLRAELASSVPALLDYATRAVPTMPPKAYRWIGEMEEIAQTFAAVGLPPGMLQGAADVYRFVGESPLGRERTEERTQGKTLEAAVEGLARTLKR